MLGFPDSVLAIASMIGMLVGLIVGDAEANVIGSRISTFVSVTIWIFFFGCVCAAGCAGFVVATGPGDA
jgi:hypothetical protein